MATAEEERLALEAERERIENERTELEALASRLTGEIEQEGSQQAHVLEVKEAEARAELEAFADGLSNSPFSG